MFTYTERTDYDANRRKIEPGGKSRLRRWNGGESKDSKAARVQGRTQARTAAEICRESPSSIQQRVDQDMNVQ